MSNLTEILQALVSERRETLGVELKNWIDPKSLEGIQKIAKTAMIRRLLFSQACMGRNRAATVGQATRSID
jgi:hypothetical protein